jgi:hypothetical protein
MEASTISGLKGERSSVDCGLFDEAGDFSPLRATSTTPKRETSSGRDGQGGEGDVGAGVATCWRSMRP